MLDIPSILKGGMLDPDAAKPAIEADYNTGFERAQAWRNIQMRALRLIGAMIFGLATLLAAGPASRAYAAPPSFETIIIDQIVPAVGLTNACGFPVQRHDELTIIVRVFTDTNGNVIKEIDSYHGTQTFSANGHSAVGRTTGPEIFLFHPDGSLTINSNGPTRFVVLPGGGPVLGHTGHITVEVDPDGNVTSMTSSGLDATSNVATLCAALAP
jgi:hypothetical protein